MKNRKPAKKFGRRYPWRSWFARGRFVLTRGVEYDCRTYSMATMIRIWASRARVRASVLVSEDEERITVEISERDGGGAA